MQIWRAREFPKGDKFQYTHFAHKLNSFESAPATLLKSDSRLRLDRYFLEKGDMNKSAIEKSRSVCSLHIAITARLILLRMCRHQASSDKSRCRLQLFAAMQWIRALLLP